MINCVSDVEFGGFEFGGFEFGGFVEFGGFYHAQNYVKRCSHNYLNRENK